MRTNTTGPPSAAASPEAKRHLLGDAPHHQRLRLPASRSETRADTPPSFVANTREEPALRAGNAHRRRLPPCTRRRPRLAPPSGSARPRADVLDAAPRSPTASARTGRCEPRATLACRVRPQQATRAGGRHARARRTPARGPPPAAHPDARPPRRPETRGSVEVRSAVDARWEQA
jgi:hypothetical protein